MANVTMDDLNRMDEPAFVAALGDIYEHAPWVAEAAYGARPFAGAAALHAAMTAAVRSAGADRQGALIAGHPDLAGKAAREGVIAAESKNEQASAGLDRLSESEFAEFHRLNNAYREKFGIPFIICVRRHGKDSILGQFARRLGNDNSRERDTALEEIHRIAALRLDQRIAASARLAVHGRLSTHVLDIDSGRPAADVAIELYEIDSSGRQRRLLQTATDADGRTPRPLLADQPIPIAQYELRFNVGDYFEHRRAAVADPPFLATVPVRFAVAEPEGHYHIALLVTPWSYTTYRGS